MGVDHMDRLHPVARAANVGVGAAVGLPQRMLYEKPPFCLGTKEEPFDNSERLPHGKLHHVEQEASCQDT